MYVTDKHVFVHHNKNAGVWIKDWLIEHKHARVVVYKHAPLRCLGERHRKKVKFGVVRNPFDWYVSFYHYHQQNGWYKGLPFKEYVKKHLENSRGLIAKAERKNVLNKHARIHPPAARHLNIGSCTFHFIHFFAYNAVDILQNWTNTDLDQRWEQVCDLDVLMRFERVRQDMSKLFPHRVSHRRNSIVNAPPKNTSRHGRYQEYYDADLRKLVEEKDGIMLEHLGYDFYAGSL